MKVAASKRKKRQAISDGGVYACTHVPSGRRYVGQTMTLNKRISHHKTMLKAGRHHNVVLQRDWTLHGAEAFRFDVLMRFQTKNDRTLCYRYEREHIAAQDPSLSYNLLSENERKSSAVGIPLKRRVVMLTPDEWARFDENGGLDWLRKLIDRARS